MTHPAEARVASQDASCSLFRYRGRRRKQKDTSSNASREVPERTHNDTNEGGETARTAASFHSVVAFESDSQVFLVTHPKHGLGLRLLTPFPRGKSVASPDSPCGISGKHSAKYHTSRPNASKIIYSKIQRSLPFPLREN